jgi:hypothetical protein
MRSGELSSFDTTGMEHSPNERDRTAWRRTPWSATQRAAWEALTKAAQQD